jgi:polyisoprenoid-binding protein YceI
MKTETKIPSIIIALVMLIPFWASGQYVCDKANSSITINGTSNLHDWAAKAEKTETVLSTKLDGQKITHIETVEVSIPVLSIKSGKSAMDENIYKALKAKGFPNIQYKMTSYTLTPAGLFVSGELMVAGVAQKLKTRVNYKVEEDHLTFYGELNLKMTDFKIKPPEFLYGSFKTGDQISIKFNFIFCNNNNI